MKYFIVILFLSFSNPLLSQESKFRVLNEGKIGDSLVRQTAELMIFNNTSHQICLKVSWFFSLKILSMDTVELAPLNIDNGCTHYDLWVTQEDTKVEVNDLPRYPLVLNSRTCFVATVNLLRDSKCKDSWIEYSYISDPDVDYNELVNKFYKHE